MKTAEAVEKQREYANRMYNTNIDNYNYIIDDILMLCPYSCYRQDVKEWVKINALARLSTEFFKEEIYLSVLIGKIATILPEVFDEARSVAIPVLEDVAISFYENYLCEK